MFEGRANGISNDQTPNARKLKYRSQSMGDKFHRQKGNSPDRQIRSLSVR